MISRRCLAAATAAVAVLPRRAWSQTIAKPARMIVGFPPGGSVDVAARLIVDQMKGYAPSIIIDNRPGAGGRTALEAVKVGPRDGSLMTMARASTIVLAPHLYKSLRYDPVQDFS